MIELLIVIAIIGVLAAIAIPQFSSYRTRSYDSAVQTDLRNAATAQEAYYVDHSLYCSDFSTLQTKYNIYLSSGVVIDMVGSQDSYTLTGYHSSGGKTYTLTGPGGSVVGS